jgi:selenocysteine lyase/cysteine desulfurase
MRAKFAFASSFTPLNHGSYGATPLTIQEKHFSTQRVVAERPDVFIVYQLPDLIDESRRAVAPLLGVPVDEVVLLPNATTGINTVLRNLRFDEGDVIVHFSAIYDSCEKTIASIGEMSPLRPSSILIEYPIEDAEIVKRFRETVAKEKAEGKNVKIAMFDTVLTFPGARMPWEDLVSACRDLGVLSLIDGAHGIGHIDLTHLGKVNPDFFVSNCHKYDPHPISRFYAEVTRWLYVPRGCAVFHVPVRNQHLIRTSFPTSHSYQYPSEKSDIAGKPQFVNLFEFVATIDYTPYTCVPAAIKFREEIGGEEAIRNYCWDVARVGGECVAEILGTEVMDNKSGSMSKCCFANVRLPLDFKRDGEAQSQHHLSIHDVLKALRWLNYTAVKEFDTYLQIGFHSGAMWVRLSGQIYLSIKDFDWVGFKLKELCDRLNKDPSLCSM